MPLNLSSSHWLCSADPADPRKLQMQTSDRSNPTIFDSCTSQIFCFVSSVNGVHGGIDGDGDVNFKFGTFSRSLSGLTFLVVL